MIEFVIFTLPALAVLAAGWMIYDWCREIAEQTDRPCISEPFSEAKYLERMEKALLEAQEQKETVDQTVILWWGLDGLTLDENGNLKWISRRKPEPVNQNVFYQPCQSVLYGDNKIIDRADMCQCTQEKIDELMMLNTAMEIQAKQEQLYRQIQSSCCVQQYHFGGW